MKSPTYYGKVFWPEGIWENLSRRLSDDSRLEFKSPDAFEALGFLFSQIAMAFRLTSKHGI